MIVNPVDGSHGESAVKHRGGQLLGRAAQVVHADRAAPDNVRVAFCLTFSGAGVVMVGGKGLTVTCSVAVLPWA